MILLFNLPTKYREVGCFAVVFEGDFLQGFHVFIGNSEVDVCIGFHVVRVGCLWKDDGAELEVVADAELGDGSAVFLCHGFDVLEFQGCAMGNRRVGFD